MCKSKCSRKSSSKPKDKQLECEGQRCNTTLEAQDKSVERHLEDDILRQLYFDRLKATTSDQK